MPIGSDQIVHRRSSVEELRCPHIEGLPRDIVHLLHHSLTRLVFLRRSLEASDLQLGRARRAAVESRELLARLRKL